VGADVIADPKQCSSFNIKHTKAIGPSDPNAAGFLPEVKTPIRPGG